jgi:hypothetical protein
MAFKVEPFQLAYPKWPSFLNTSYDLDAWNVLCVLYSLRFGKDDKQYGTNFWGGKTFSYEHTTVEPFNSYNIILKYLCNTH